MTPSTAQVTGPERPTLGQRGKGRWPLGGLLAWLLALLLTGSLQAQIPDPGATSWQSTRYSQENGLLSNDVRALLVTGDAVWVGTDRGLSRFDGVWTSWPAGSDTPFAGSVQALAAEAAGGIWIGMDTGALLRWRGAPHTRGAFEALAPAPAAIRAIHEGQGRLWVGTTQGLYRLNGSEWIREEAVPGPVYAIARQESLLWVATEDGLWLLQRDQWTRLGTGDGLPHDTVYAIWIAPDGRVWVGTEQGLATRDPLSGAWQVIPTEGLNGLPYRILSLDGGEKGLWGGTDGDGVFWLTPDGALLPFGGEVGLAGSVVRVVAIDPEGSVWLGSATGVARHDVTMWVAQNWGGEFQINVINSLVEDASGALWMGTDISGVRVALPVDPNSRALDPLSMEVLRYSQAEGLPSETVLDLALAPDGVVWAATDNGLAYFNRTQSRWAVPFPANELPSPLIHALRFLDDTLWLATDAGLVRYSLADRDLALVPELDGTAVRALAVDRLRRLWVGTLAQGIYLREADGSWRHFPPARGSWQPGGDTVPDGVVGSLAASPDGTVWAGIANYGVIRWDGVRWLELDNEAIVPEKTINELYVDPLDGSLWIGTGGGLARYDGRTWAVLSAAQVLAPNTPTNAVIRSAAGNYWFGTDQGLVYFRPEHTPPWLAIQEIVGNYTRTPEQTIQVEIGEPVSIRVAAGDLHTAPEDLVVLARIQGPDRDEMWAPIQPGPYQLPDLSRPGNYRVEFMVRDLAFNYSDIQGLDLVMVPPPPTVTIPLLGYVIERRLALVLGILGLITLGSFAYISWEIAQSRQRVQEAVRRGFNPFVSGEPVRRADMFFGREDLLQRIIDSLHENSIMIYGERRIGKTSVLYQLRDRLRDLDDPAYWFVPIYIDLEGTPEEEFFHFLMDEMVHGLLTLPNADTEIRPYLQDLALHTKRAAAYTYRDFLRDLRQIVQVMEDYARRHHPGKKLRIILLLDEVDVISEYSRPTQQQLRRIFMQNPALGGVVAGIRVSREWDRVESPWYNMFVEFQLEPFSREEAIALLTEPVAGYYEWEPAALEFVIEQSQGRPFRLQQYALEAVNHMLERGSRTITLDDVEAAHARIQSVAYDHDVGIQEALARQQREQQATPTPAPSDTTETGENTGAPHA